MTSEADPSHHAAARPTSLGPAPTDSAVADSAGAQTTQHGAANKVGRVGSTENWNEAANSQPDTEPADTMSVAATPVESASRPPRAHGVASIVIPFETFYRDERDEIVRALALTIGNIDLAAEATDEAMVRAYQRWGTVGEFERPAGWVYRVALNYCRSRMRRVARKLRYTAQLPSHNSTSAEAAFTDRVGDELRDALNTLSIDQRAVVIQRVLLGFSEAETAASLGIRVGTVKSRLHRALGRLREELPHLAGPIAVAARDNQPRPTAPSSIQQRLHPHIHIAHQGDQS